MAHPNPAHTLGEGFLVSILSGEHRDALEICASANELGLTGEELLIDVICPAMAEIGMLWERGEIGIADEHRATAIATEVVESCAREMARPAPSGLRALVSTPAGETHALPARIFAALLTLRGWIVDFLGADMPGEALLEFLEKNPRDVVALTVTRRHHLSVAVETLRSLSRIDPRPTRLLGGAAVEASDRSELLDVADIVSNDTRLALAELEERLKPTAAAPNLDMVLSRVGARVRDLRKQRALTQGALAQAAHLDRSYLSLVEKGRQNLSIGALVRIAAALESDLSGFLDAKELV